MDAELLNIDFDANEPTRYELLTADRLNPQDDDHSLHAGIIRDRSLQPITRNYLKWCHENNLTPLSFRIEQTEAPYLVHGIYSFGHENSAEFYSPFKLVDGVGAGAGYNTHVTMNEDGGEVTVHRTEKRYVETPQLIVEVPNLESRRQWESFVSEMCPRVIYEYDEDAHEVGVILSDVFNSEMQGLSSEAENVRIAKANGDTVLGFIAEDASPGEGATFTLSAVEPTDSCVTVPVNCVSPSLDEWTYDGLVLFPCQVEEWKMIGLAA